MNCLAHIIKYILFVCNLVFLLCGILLIVFGSLAIKNLKDFLQFADANSTSTLPICVLIIGCIIFIVSFFGCCGAIKESRCLINTYCVSMLILIILQIGLIVYAWIASNSFIENAGALVDKAWNNHRNQPLFMDTIQMTYKCCGWKLGSIDYTNNNEQIPNSCCGLVNAACDPLQAITLPGCRPKVMEFWGSQNNLIKYAGLGVAAVEFIALVLGWFLSSSIKVSLQNKTY